MTVWRLNKPERGLPGTRMPQICFIWGNRIYQNGPFSNGNSFTKIANSLAEASDPIGLSGNAKALSDNRLRMKVISPEAVPQGLGAQASDPS